MWLGMGTSRLPSTDKSDDFPQPRNKLFEREVLLIFYVLQVFQCIFIKLLSIVPKIFFYKNILRKTNFLKKISEKMFTANKIDP